MKAICMYLCVFLGTFAYEFLCLLIKSPPVSSNLYTLCRVNIMIYTFSASNHAKNRTFSTFRKWRNLENATKMYASFSVRLCFLVCFCYSPASLSQFNFSGNRFLCCCKLMLIRKLFYGTQMHNFRSLCLSLIRRMSFYCCTNKSRVIRSQILTIMTLCDNFTIAINHLNQLRKSNKFRIVFLFSLWFDWILSQIRSKLAWSQTMFNVRLFQ